MDAGIYCTRSFETVQQKILYGRRHNIHKNIINYNIICQRYITGKYVGIPSQLLNILIYALVQVSRAMTMENRNEKKKQRI